MPYGAHETMEVHEILNGKLNTIAHFEWYAQQAAAPEIRQMLDRHLQSAVYSYDRLVAYTHDYNTDFSNQHGYQAAPVHVGQIRYGLNQPESRQPQRKGGFDDDQILAAMLACHKNSAKNAMAASLECADPNVRRMLVNDAMTCSSEAYEVFLLMNEKGQYQVPTLNDHTAKTFLHSYEASGSMPMESITGIEASSNLHGSPAAERPTQSEYGIPIL